MDELPGAIRLEARHAVDLLRLPVDRRHTADPDHADDQQGQQADGGRREHLHADPHFRETIDPAIAGRTFDVVIATYGRIRVVAEENTPDNRVSPGERYARIYEINMSRCIFCGYCELACPFDAITLGNEFEISEHNRDDQIYTKDMLLAEPVKKVPVTDRDLYDTPIPYYQSHS